MYICTHARYIHIYINICCSYFFSAYDQALNATLKKGTVNYTGKGVSRYIFIYMIININTHIYIYICNI